MDDVRKQKRKANAPRPFQWWLLVIGFALGAAFMLVVTSRNGQPAAVYAGGNPDTFYLTATHIIEQATASANRFQLTSPANSLQLTSPADPLLLTATAIIAQSEQQFDQPDDSMLLTATAFVAQATQQAALSGNP